MYKSKIRLVLNDYNVYVHFLSILAVCIIKELCGLYHCEAILASELRNKQSTLLSKITPRQPIERLGFVAEGVFSPIYWFIFR